MIALPKHTCTAHQVAESDQVPIIGVVSVSEALARVAAEGRVPEENRRMDEW